VIQENPNSRFLLGILKTFVFLIEEENSKFITCEIDRALYLWESEDWAHCQQRIEDI
jgi:hypothetical protein